MAAPWYDTFNYDLPLITRKWSQYAPAPNGTELISLTGGPFNGPYLKLTNISGAGGNQTGQVRRVYGWSGAKCIANFWFNCVGTFAVAGSGTTNTIGNIVGFLQAGSVQVYLRLNTNGTISLLRGTSVIATSAAALHQATWHHIEWVTLIDPSSGTSDLKIDGQAAAGFTFSGNTRATSSSTFDETFIGQFGTSGTGASVDCRYANFVPMDGSGSFNNTFIGVARSDMGFPTGDGTSPAWTLSTGSSHFALVDENPPNTTDYAYASTATTKERLTKAAISPSGTTIKAVQVEVWARREDAGVAGLKAGFRIGGVDYMHATELSPPFDYAALTWVFETDPSTGVAWTESAYNSAELVLEKTS